jgi:hypothetical protein
MGSAANNLTNQGFNNSQFNANLGLQNNNQQMAQQQNNMSNGLQGINTYGAANNLANSQYQNQMSLLEAPNTYNNANLTNYANLINPTAGMGGSQVTTSPIYSNPVGSANSGGLLGLGVAKSMGAQPINTSSVIGQQFNPGSLSGGSSNTQNWF